MVGQSVVAALPFGSWAAMCHRWAIAAPLPSLIADVVLSNRGRSMQPLFEEAEHSNCCCKSGLWFCQPAMHRTWSAFRTLSALSFSLVVLWSQFHALLGQGVGIVASCSWFTQPCCQKASELINVTKSGGHLVAQPHNKSLHRTFDPPPAFAAAKSGVASNAGELRR